MRKSESPFLPLPAGEVHDLAGLKLTLGPAQEIEPCGFSREGKAERAVYRVLELPGAELPPALEAALAVPNVAAAAARQRGDGRTLIALRPAPGPSLEWLLQRAEGLPLWDLAIVESLADLFQAVHDAQLVFREVTPAMFSVAPDGTVQLEEPEALRRASEAPSRAASIFTAPEVLGGADGDPRADQFSLGMLAYALFTGRLPFRRGELPLPKIFRSELPHGLASVLQRATRAVPAERHPTCRAFATELRARTVPKGASPRQLSIGVFTEIGRLKSQSIPVNQDAFFHGYDAATQRGLLLVADGVSTADVGSGDLASSFVRDAAKAAWEGPVGEILRSHKGPMPQEWAKAALEAILEDANARIYAFLKQPIFVGALGPGTHPPGSTAVLALLDGDRLTYANLGDSRMYLLRDGLFEQVTVDQDLRTELLKAGRDPRTVGDSASLGALTHSVGSFFFDNEGGIVNRRLDADVQVLHLRAGDRLLLCSDGVPDCLGEGHEEVMAHELGAGPDPQAIAQRLCRLADEALGADNITAMVVLAQ